MKKITLIAGALALVSSTTNAADAVFSLTGNIPDTCSVLTDGQKVGTVTNTIDFDDLTNGGDTASLKIAASLALTCTAVTEVTYLSANKGNLSKDTDNIPYTLSEGVTPVTIDAGTGIGTSGGNMSSNTHSFNVSISPSDAFNKPAGDYTDTLTVTVSIN